MDKSGVAKSNYEEKLHSCPRNHLCQRPHNETQSLLKWAWQAQRISILSSLILSPRTFIIKPSLIKATLWKWWTVIQIGNVLPKGLCDAEVGWATWHAHTHTYGTCRLPRGRPCRRRPERSDWGADQNKTVDAPVPWESTSRTQPVITRALTALRRTHKT